MKILIKLSIIFLVLFTIQLNAQWFPQNSLVTEYLHSASFINQNSGWVAGDSGVILHTSDGGINWDRQSTNYTTPLYSISFCDEFNGWAVGDNGIVLKTNNQGVDWVRVYNDTSKNVRNLKVECISPTTTIVLRDWFTGDFNQDTKIWKTEDGGESWQDISPYDSWSFLTDFSFTSSDSGWACGHGGDIDGYQIHRTTDGGTNWSTKHFNFPTYWSMMKISFNNHLEGWATDWNTLYHTYDGGSSWNVTSVLNFTDLKDMVMLGNVGYASRYIGKIEKTTDYGNNWIEQSTASNNYANDIEFINKNVGWIVGSNGMISKTINGGVTSVDEYDQYVKSFNLYQNYPNPFNPVTTLSYSIPELGIVELKVYSVLGREVAVLVNKEQQAGSYEVQFDASELTNGIYFYRLKAGCFVESRKMVLLK